jgi:hypothetical protein
MSGKILLKTVSYSKSCIATSALLAIGCTYAIPVVALPTMEASYSDAGQSCCSSDLTPTPTPTTTPTPTSTSIFPSTSASTSAGTSESPSTSAKAASETMKARIESAQKIIDSLEKIKKSAKLYHEHAVQLIADSKRLQGEAQVLQTRVPVLPSAAKLSGAQLETALKQYNADVNSFAAHAGAYDQHLKTFQTTIGECHANQQAIDGAVKQFEIHTAQFHVPTLPASIRPPHLCPKMMAQMGDMSSQISGMMMDQKRVMEAQNALAHTEGQLQNAEAETASTHTKAINEAKRQEGEQALAAEFNRLKDEYDLLKVEKDQVSGNNQLGKITRSSVSAKVKKN